MVEIIGGENILISSAVQSLSASKTESLILCLWGRYSSDSSDSRAVKVAYTYTYIYIYISIQVHGGI